MSGAGKTVCVTGASGYIASWLVKFLLHRGYTVKASVRDPNNPKKTDHLLKLDGAKERLQLFKANLLEDGSFVAAVDGCEGVFHTASPFYHAVTDPQLLTMAGPGLLKLLLMRLGFLIQIFARNQRRKGARPSHDKPSNGDRSSITANA